MRLFNFFVVLTVGHVLVSSSDPLFLSHQYMPYNKTRSTVWNGDNYDGSTHPAFFSVHSNILCVHYLYDINDQGASEHSMQIFKHIKQVTERIF